MIAPCASEYPVYSLNHQKESAFKVIGARIQSSRLHAVYNCIKIARHFPLIDETVKWLRIRCASRNTLISETSKLLVFLVLCFSEDLHQVKPLMITMNAFMDEFMPIYSNK
jgi:hypothetical protein